MNKKILCVDDEESILKGFRLHLRKGFDLFTANSGEDGLRVFDEEGDLQSFFRTCGCLA